MSRSVLTEEIRRTGTVKAKTIKNGKLRRYRIQLRGLAPSGVSVILCQKGPSSSSSPSSPPSALSSDAFFSSPPPSKAAAAASTSPCLLLSSSGATCGRTERVGVVNGRKRERLGCYDRDSVRHGLAVRCSVVIHQPRQPLSIFRLRIKEIISQRATTAHIVGV